MYLCIFVFLYLYCVVLRCHFPVPVTRPTPLQPPFCILYTNDLRGRAQDFHVHTETPSQDYHLEMCIFVGVFTMYIVHCTMYIMRVIRWLMVSAAGSLMNHNFELKASYSAEGSPKSAYWAEFRISSQELKVGVESTISSFPLKSSQWI